MITFAAAAAVLLCATPVDAQFVVSEAADPVGAVVFLHGWSQGLTADDILPVLPSTPMVGQLVDAGWSVYMPYLDSDWGSGVDVVSDVVAEARADGHDRIRVIGVSAGALTGLNWAWRNPDAFDELYLITPVFDLAGLHAADTPVAWTNAPSITASIDARYPEGFAGFDPAQNTAAVAAIADRVSVFAARDDEVIDWVSLEAWASGLGIDLVPSAAVGENGGGHIFATAKPAFTSTVEGWFM